MEEVRGKFSTKDTKINLRAACIQRENSTVMTLSFRTDRSGQTVQTQIRLLLEEQSDQGLHCLLFHLHNFDKIPYGLAKIFGIQKIRNFTVITLNKN